MYGRNLPKINISKRRYFIPRICQSILCINSAHVNLTFCCYEMLHFLWEWKNLSINQLNVLYRQTYQWGLYNMFSLSITTFTVKPSIKSLWKLLIKTFCNNITINQIFEGYEKNQKGIFQPQWTQKHESLSLLTCMDVVLPFLSRFYTSECFHILLICLVHDWARTRLHHRKEK